MVTMNKIRLLKPMLGLKIPRRWQGVMLCAFLVALFWLIRYRYSGRFGLYEDDLTIIPAAGQMSFPEVLKYIGQYIINLRGHIRPLSDSFIYLFSNIGWRLGGLPGLYIMGFAVESINICLLFALVARLSNLRLAALITLAYVLYSADTTQAFLTHSLGVHPSITLLLVSLHCYVSKRRFLSYLLAFIILFSYETPFPLFFAAPLLVAEPWDKRRWLRIGIHCLIVSAMLIGVVLFRSYLGDSRVAGLRHLKIILEPLGNMLYGPFMNVIAYGTRVVETMKNFSTPGVIVFTVGGAMLLVAFLILIPDHREASANQGVKPSGALLADIRSLKNLAIAGLAMLALGYAMIFTTSPADLYGRATRAHTAAGVGAAFLSGIAAYLLLEYFKNVRVKWVGLVLVTAMCAPLIGFGFLLQADYIRAWQSQQRFWTALLPMISDAGPDDVILVEPGIFYTERINDSTYIEANTWNMPRVLNQLYDYPIDFTSLPRVFRLRVGWDRSILKANGMLNLDERTVYAPPSLLKNVSPSDVIFMQNNNGNMERITDSFVLNGETVNVKPYDPETQPPFSEGFLHQYMILSTP